MKTLLQLISGSILTVASAPVVVAGRAAQATGHGIVKTGSALHELGESTELKGLRFRDDGASKLSLAKEELHKDREQRKADRIAAKAKRDADALANRKARIRELEIAATMRRQLKNLDPQKLEELTRAEFRAVGV